jgi:hypothetical protein
MELRRGGMARASGYRSRSAVGVRRGRGRRRRRHRALRTVGEVGRAGPLCRRAAARATWSGGGAVLFRRQFCLVQAEQTRPDPLAVLPCHVSSYVDRIRVKMVLKH